VANSDQEGVVLVAIAAPLFHLVHHHTLRLVSDEVTSVLMYGATARGGLLYTP
jgi:hypothetical protein